MKKNVLKIGLSVGLFIFCLLGRANATLIDLGNGAIYDNIANQYWFQDLSYFTELNYEEQIISISILNSNTSQYLSPYWGDWHMASGLEMEALWMYEVSEIMENFTPTIIYNDSLHYEGRYDLPYDNFRHHTAAIFEMYNYDSKSSYYGKTPLYSPFCWTPDDDRWNMIGAWVTADAISTPVPEPSTILLFGLGLLGLAGVSRKKINTHGK